MCQKIHLLHCVSLLSLSSSFLRTVVRSPYGLSICSSEGISGVFGFAVPWLVAWNEKHWPHTALNQVVTLRLVRSPPCRVAGLFMFATGRIITVCLSYLVFVIKLVKIINCTLACWHDFDRSLTSFLFDASVGIALCYLIIIIIIIIII